MRIRTTAKVNSELDLLRRQFRFDNNAQLLRLAVNYSIYKGATLDLEIKEDGFAIDTHTLFNDDENYYEYLLTNLHPLTSYRIILTNFINLGIQNLVIDLRYAKNDPNLLLKKIMEESHVS